MKNSLTLRVLHFIIKIGISNFHNIERIRRRGDLLTSWDKRVRDYVMKNINPLRLNYLISSSFSTTSYRVSTISIFGVLCLLFNRSHSLLL
ncbi:hypothetical protein PmNV_105 [Penaeus monodon nudivirus]|uniref:Uncharacterized protein n=1 Tax=Penaeus monodon nudivirus TaxID=1529056 RepID=A0A076FD67_9VIRU|nr:hypothetical protein PmNV_105 [Penaeus monodon nudivirus]AII15893.1 hypothetical protein PmNV_105 [Penaeus monodon nudivirus]